MRFLDTLKLSFHSIFHNKIRTLITIIIVFMVSLLIMVISILGLSFYQSVNDAFMEVYDEAGAQFDLRNYYSYTQGDQSSISRSISEDEYKLVMSQFADTPELIDNVKVDCGNIDMYYLYDKDETPTTAEIDVLTSSNQLYTDYNDMRFNTKIISAYGDLDYESTGITYLKDGRLWTKEDESLKKIWVSESFIAQASAYGIPLTVGEFVVILSIKYVYSQTIQNPPPIISADRFKITGIFLDSALEELDCTQDIYMEINSVYDMVGDNLDMYNMTIVNEPKIGYVFNTEYNKMKTIVNNINESIEPNSYNGKEESRFSCNIVSELQMVKIIGAVLIGASVFICFIILIISIGSVANTIIISVDKNKRFLGVMMAVGLKKGGVKRIVEYESLFMIIAATGLSYLILTFFDYLFLPIMKSLMLLVGFASEGTVIMPIYVPIITVFAFIFMALMFSRKSLSKITNMDVISVISEVS